MKRQIYSIPAFVGLDQSADENALSPSFSPDARNMDTSYGDLAVAKGFSRFVPSPVPGTGTIRRLIMYRTPSGLVPVVAAGNSIYSYRGGAWHEEYVYPSAAGSSFGSVETAIDGQDCLIIADGAHQAVKFTGSAASVFGSSAGGSHRPVNFVVMYRSRLFAAGDPSYPNRLYWSQLPGGDRSIEDWGAVEASPNVEGGSTEVGETSGDPIVALASLSNQILIFKKYSVWRLIGDKPSNYTVERIEAITGGFAHTSLVHYADVAYFMTNNGLYLFNGVTVRRSPDADRIRGVLAEASADDSRGALAGNKLCFTLDLDGESAIVEYDMERRAYMLRTGFTVSDIASADDKLYVVTGDRYICLWNDGATYDGAPVEAYWRTPLTDLRDKGAIKALRALYLRGRADADDSAILIDASVGGVTSTHRMLLPAESAEVLEVPLINEGRAFSLRLYNEAGGGFTVIGGAELELTVKRRVD